MTKAYFRDGNAEHALKHFTDKIGDARKEAMEREDKLVGKFDEIFGQTEVSFEEFKEKYAKFYRDLKGQMQRSFVSQRISKLLKDRVYDEVEALFQYYVLSLEEVAYENQRFPGGLLAPNEQKALDNIHERKSILESQFSSRMAEEV